MKKRISNILAAFIFASLVYGYFTHNYSITVNATESLKNFAFLIKLNTLPTKDGEYVAFYAKHNKYYDAKKQFIKIVGGLPGETVIEQDRIFYVGEREIGRAKEISLHGDKLELGPTGIIPEGHYFVFSPNKDSYDSRYKDIGFVPESDVAGVAIPIL